MHRDLTPFNVFVCEGEQLKLGDFGIAAHQRNQRGVTADAFNLFHVPNDIAWGRVRRWHRRDDIYQIGLLAAMLLRGDITSPMPSKDVRRLPCSDHLKEVIHRCLGSRGRRYEAANDLIAALKERPAAKPGQTTHILVRGKPNAQQIAGKDGGSKPDRGPPARGAGRLGDGDRRAAVLAARAAGCPEGGEAGGAAA